MIRELALLARRRRTAAPSPAGPRPADRYRAQEDRATGPFGRHSRPLKRPRTPPPTRENGRLDRPRRRFHHVVSWHKRAGSFSKKNCKKDP